MKKYILSLLFISVAFIGKQTFAQVGQGLFVGGALGINSYSSKTNHTHTSGNTSTTTKPIKEKGSSFGFMPQVGYFFTDNIGAGVMIGYNTDKTELTEEVSLTHTDIITSKMGTFTIGLFGRYAQQLGDGDFYLYGDVGFGIGRGSGTNKKEEREVIGSIIIQSDITESTVKSSIITLGITPGILYFPTKKIGLETSLGNVLGYTSRKTTIETPSGNQIDEDEIKESEVNILDLDSFAFTFGLNFYFNR